ncbi:hypothetical protein N9174_04465 [bacterium]|nr:hypothetical protein [bacterium]
MLYVLMRYDDDITDTTPKSGDDMSGCGLSKSGVGKDIALKR